MLMRQERHDEHTRVESDSLGLSRLPPTNSGEHRLSAHSSISVSARPDAREMISAYAILKRAAPWPIMRAADLRLPPSS